MSARRWTDDQRRMMRAAGRRHLRRAAAVVAGLLVVGVVVALIQRRFVESQDAALADGLVQRLLAVETAEVPRVLPELERYRRFADPLLGAIVRDPERAARDRLHASLALLPERPELAESLAEAALTAEPGQIAVLSDALRPFGDRLAGPLWALVRDGAAAPGRRLRAACLLAALDPESPLWEEVAAQTAADLVAENPFHAVRWAQALSPVRQRLVPPLADAFRSRATPGSQRLLAASILADYAADDVPLLVGLIGDADPQSFRLLVPALRRDPAKAIPLLSAELAREPSAGWDDGPEGPWERPGPDVESVLAAADGMLAERFALAQTLPLADLGRLAESLGRAGYRPCCFRPFATPAGVRAAVVWRRDGRHWKWVHGATADEVRATNADCRRQGLLPADLAVYAAGAEGAASFAALWAEPDPDLMEAALYVDVPDKDHEGYWRSLNAKDFVPRANQVGRGPDGGVRRSSVRWRFRRTAPEYRDAWCENEPSYARDVAAGWHQVDVRVVPTRPSAAPAYGGVWWNGGRRVTRECHGLSPADHAGRCRELAAEGFRPAALSVARNGAAGRLEAASVWERPVPDDEVRDALARRQAAAAIALLRLGKPDEVWPLLRLRPDPSLRGWLIQGLAPAGADPALLVERLTAEPDASARRALLLALAEYPDAGGEPSRSAAADLYRSDGDAGVHSAARFLLQRGQQQQRLEALDRELRAGPGGRGWLTDGEGHTLTVIRRPVEFVMGSPGDEPRHDRYRELQRRVRIGRSFAVATTEVTLEQYRCFRPDHVFAPAYTPDPTCPVTMVSWYDAIAYCRWLSDREGIDEDQKCYPSVEEIERCRDQRQPLTLPADLLSRRGYRLPTEAEWEYACRAGTETPRHFGRGEALLSAYAWTGANSGYRAASVGRLAPNDFGLFDTLGGAMEWCQDYDRKYDFVPGKVWDDDLGSPEVRPEDYRVRRGGSFMHQPSDARAAQRDPSPPAMPHVFLGFRVVRTVD
jgi:formylglycine-generating enzyme required for sulfatase activity